MKQISITLLVVVSLLCAPAILNTEANAVSFIDAPMGVPVAQPSFSLGSTPLFVTDITSTDDGRLVVSTKGDRSISIYNSDMTQKQKSWEVAAVPTGVAVSGDKFYATLDNST
ncbi:MAG: hypothetical protein R3Y19_03760, partial [Rikenellaceae bacterium]